MRLCFVGDPRSVHTQRWVRWFAGRHQVTFVATDDDDALSDLRVAVLPREARVPGVRLLGAARLLRRVVREQQPDVLHAHYINEPGWLAAAAGRRPFVITAWGSDIYRAPTESRLARHLNPRAVRAADWVTCDSADQARELRAWGVPDERLSVIGWGVDRERFNPSADGSGLRARLGIPATAPVVLSPRQWLPNSNIEAIVAAHAQLPSDVHLLLKRQPRFEGTHDRVVAAAVEQSPARQRIHIVGELEEGELPGLYAAADVVVSLCITDGTPVSVLEAMAVGRPIVAFDNASLAEWVSEPGGRLVDSLGGSAVAAAVEELSRPEARAAAAVHNTAVVAERADRGTEMSRVEAIYDRLAHADGRSGP